MSERDFSLAPFPGSFPLPDLKISGTVRRSAKTLSCRYMLCGPLAKLVIPEKAATPVRRDGLWRDTCFELFFADHGARQYREVNLSPAGHWNAYYFTAYRQGMRQDTAVSGVPFAIRKSGDIFDLALEIDLGGIVSPDILLDVGVCVVLNSASGDTTYWALAHPGTKPDFHNREGFVLGL